MESKFGRHQCQTCGSDHRSNNIPYGDCKRCAMIKLGYTMANPIRRSLDYQGLARRILQIEPLPSKITKIESK